MYLVGTNVISEARKRDKANRGVTRFFKLAQTSGSALYLSVITIGEIRRGIELIRYRGDIQQATQLETWIDVILNEFGEHILDFCHDEAQVWGRLRVSQPENALDKQIAATAITHELTVVTRNTNHFERLGLTLLNPFV
jgi:hypothetical protein